MKNIKTIIIAILILFQSISYASLGSIIDDSTITAKVKSQIALDTTLSIFQVDVSTHHGVVALSGLVNSDTQAATLIQLITSIEGVKDVDINHLKIRDSVQPFADAFITSKVKGRFLKDGLFGTVELAHKISVETRNGVVYLKGDLDNKAQGAQAIAIARTVAGVKSVDYNFNYNN